MGLDKRFLCLYIITFLVLASGNFSYIFEITVKIIKIKDKEIEKFHFIINLISTISNLKEYRRHNVSAFKLTTKVCLKMQPIPSERKSITLRAPKNLDNKP